MSGAASSQPKARGGRGRSILAVTTGLVAVFVLSLSLDQLFHVLGVVPALGELGWETGDYVLASCYRLVINIFGCWLAARLAPRNPMKHALILGWIALALTIVGLIGAIMQNLGDLWYPALLAVTALPCAWLGGRLYTRAHP